MATLKESLENQRKFSEAMKMNKHFTSAAIEASKYIQSSNIASLANVTSAISTITKMRTAPIFKQIREQANWYKQIHNQYDWVKQIASTRKIIEDMRLPYTQIQEMRSAFLPQETLSSILKTREWIDTLKATSSLFLDSTNLEFSDNVTAVINEFDTYDFSDEAIFDDSQNEELVNEILSNDSPSKLQIVKLTIIGFAEALKENPNIQKIIKTLSNPIVAFILGSFLTLALTDIYNESPLHKKMKHTANLLFYGETEPTKADKVQQLEKIQDELENLKDDL